MLVNAVNNRAILSDQQLDPQLDPLESIVYQATKSPVNRATNGVT